MGHKKHCNAKNKGNAGFSLVELAIVILLASLAVTPLYQILLVKPLNNGSSIELALSGLAEHLRVHGTFPCPADPALAPGDATYGEEGTCVAVGGITIVNGVAIGAVPVDTLKIAMDCVNSDEQTIAGDIFDVLGLGAGTGGDTVSRKSILSTKDTLMGTRNRYKLDITRCITNDDMLDEHDNKLLYAVDISATTAAGGGAVFNPFTNSSNIEVWDANDIEMTLNNPTFIILSHGKDGNGALDVQGTAQEACGTSLDAENCNGDAIFRYMPVSNVSGLGRFDDKVDFSLAGFEREDNQWNWAGNTGARDISFGDPSLTNTRMIVGDGTALPATGDQLVINNGNLLADDDVNTGNFNIVVETAGKKVATPRFCYIPYDAATSHMCCNDDGNPLPACCALNTCP